MNGRSRSTDWSHRPSLKLRHGLSGGGSIWIGGDRASCGCAIEVDWRCCGLLFHTIRDRLDILTCSAEKFAEEIAVSIDHTVIVRSGICRVAGVLLDFLSSFASHHCLNSQVPRPGLTLECRDDVESGRSFSRSGKARHEPVCDYFLTLSVQVVETIDAQCVCRQ